MNIRRQISLIYLYEGISALKMVDMVWVLFLLRRGFSLAEVGIAEGFFHGISMCCEIPSGMAADLLGRKKTLALSGILSFVSCLCMIVSAGMEGVLISMGLNALSYNLVSGTREALTYDSLLSAGKEEQYLKISSVQEVIYQSLSAASCLTAIAAVAMGYRWAYGVAAVQGLLAAGTAWCLKEPIVPGIEKKKFFLRELGSGMIGQFRESLSFLLRNGKVRSRMIFSGLSSAGCYLMYMLMQEHFVEIGIPEKGIGIVLFVMSTGAILGAYLGQRWKCDLRKTLLIAGFCGAGGIALSGNKDILPALFAAWIAHAADEIVMLRIEETNQNVFESRIRATMVSVESMTRSVLMGILSPFVGMVGEKTSISVSMVVLAAVMLIIGGCLMVFRPEAFSGSEKKGGKR